MFQLIKGFKNFFECVVQEYTDSAELTWFKHSHLVNITKQSKDWWNKNCQVKLTAYRSSKRVEEWKDSKRTVKTTKYIFWDDKI